MGKLELFLAIGELDDDILRDAESFSGRERKRAPAWVKWGGLAACAALAVCAVWFTTGTPVSTTDPRASEALLPSASLPVTSTPEVTTGAANVDRPAVEPAEETARSFVKLHPNKLIELIEEPQTSYGMFALMVEDFVPMTREELLDYYGVTLPIEELFPDLTATDPEEDGRGIYRSGERGVYFDTNTFSFTSTDGVQTVNIALDKAFHMPTGPWELIGDELYFTNINGWELALFHYVDRDGNGYWHTEFRQDGADFRVTGKNTSELEYTALLEALLEQREDFAPGEVRTVTGKVTAGISRQTLTASQTDGNTGSISTDTFVTYRGPLGLLTVNGGDGYPSLRIELTPEQAAQLWFADLDLGDLVTVRFTGEPATIGTVWNQQLVSIEPAQARESRSAVP